MGFLLKIPYLRHESFDLSDDTPTETTTPLFHRVACGLGHVLNDVIRQLFFSFRLVYFMNVLGLSASLSGWLLLEKPLVHIVLSPVSAILVDRVYIPFVSRKIGKRKSWHLLGTILEAVFIPFFFATHYLIQSENSKTELMMIHLGILNVILAFGDGILDISHLSLIAVIARDQMEAVEMNSLRTSFSYLSGILTFVVAWVIFGLDSESQLSESSSRDFMVLTAVLVAVGVLSSLIFYSGTKEPSSSPRIPLRKLSTLAATNLARLTSFVPSGGLGEPMPNFATGLKIARKKSRPARKSSHRVSLCDGIRWKPTKCDTYTYEENTLLKKKELLKENHRYRSASLPNDTNSIGVINQGLHASVLDRCKEPAPVNGSTMRAPLSSKTEANSQPVLNSGFNTARKESCPARIMTRVNFCVETQRKPTECNMNEEKMSQEEKEPRNQSCQSRSSSLLSDPYRTGVINKGFSVSVLDLYSDDESNYTGRVTKEAAPINQSAVSLETKNDLLPDTKPNSQVAINSELNTANKKNRPSRKKACVTFWDEIPSTPPKDDANERHTLSNEEEAPIDNLQSWSSSFNDPDLTGVVSRGRNVSFLERYSDDRESTGTSRAGKELAPSDKSTVSLDTKSVSFSQIKSNRKPVVKSCNTESGLPQSTRGNKTMRRWLIDPRLYLVSIAYSCTWMLQIHAYSYLPLFLLYRLRFSKESIAYLPLILTISATVSSSFSKKIVQKIGDKLCFIFAAIFAFIAGVMSYFMEAESWTSKVMIYPTVILLGFGFSSMFVNSLSLATELIGKNTKTTGFVFAVMTLIASVTNGSLLMTIQELFPKQRNKDCEECGDYLRLVFSLVNVAVAIVSVITVLLLYCINRFKGKSSSSDED